MAIKKSSVDSKGYSIELEYDERNTNIEQNTSRVYFKLYLVNRNTYFQEYRCRASVYVEGKTSHFEQVVNLSGLNQRTLIIDDYFTVEHRSDGGKFATIQANFVGRGGYSPNELKIEAFEYELTTIPRASKLTSTIKSSYRTDEPFTATYTKYYSGFITYWHMEYLKGGTWYTLGTDKITPSATIDQHVVNKNKLAQEFPNASRVQARIYLSTFQNSTKIGGTYHNFDLHFDNSFCPDLTLTTVERNTMIKALNLGYFVKGLSIVEVEPHPTLKYGATVKRYQWSTGTNQVTPQNTTTTVATTVIDSREKEKSASINITAVDYEHPKIEIIKVERKNNTIVVDFKYHITPLSNKNKKEVTIGYKRTNDTGAFTKRKITVQNYSSEKHQYSFVADDRDSWELYMIVADTFGASRSAMFYVSTKVGLELVKNDDSSNYGFGLGTSAKLGEVRTKYPIIDDKTKGEYIHSRSEWIGKLENASNLGIVTTNLTEFIDSRGNIFQNGTIKNFIVNENARPFDDVAWNYATGLCIKRNEKDIQLVLFSATDGSIATTRKWGSGTGRWEKWQWIRTSQQETISSSINFNNLYIRGEYAFQSNDIVENSSNAPIGKAGWLTVRTTKNMTVIDVWWYVLQEYRTLNGDLYTRSGESGTSKSIRWSAWKKRY